MGFGFGREGSWVVWKRKVLSLEKKLFAGTGRKKEEGNKKKKRKFCFNVVYLIC